MVALDRASIVQMERLRPARVALATVRLRTEFARLAGVPCVHGNGRLLSGESLGQS